MYFHFVFHVDYILRCQFVPLSYAFRSTFGIILDMDDTQPNRLVDSDPKPGDHLDYALRPQFLGSMIGQDTIRENLEILISAAQHREEAMDHVLFYGPLVRNRFYNRGNCICIIPVRHPLGVPPVQNRYVLYPCIYEGVCNPVRIRKTEKWRFFGVG